MKYLITILLLITTNLVFAADKPYTPTPAPPVVTTATPTTLTLPPINTYGLLALAGGAHQFDWGIPDKLQSSVAIAFTEGGNQAISFGAATRVGGVLLSGYFSTTLNAPQHEDDYAIVGAVRKDW